MATPVFVNRSGATGNNNVTSITRGSLPASLVNGNLLLAVVQVQGTGKSISVSGSWTIADSDSTGNQSIAYATYIVDGAQTVPTFSWTGSANAITQTYQFSGNVNPAIGAIAKSHANASTLITSPSVVSSTDNSLIVNLLLVSNSQTITTPLNRTNLDVFANSAGSFNVCDGPLNIAGSTSDTIFNGVSFGIAINSANWNCCTIEILGSGVGVADAPRASQDTIGVVETYSTPGLIGRASQIALQTAMTYSVPVMYARASQICIQVLRTVAAAERLQPGSYLITGYPADLIVAGTPETEAHRKIRDPWDCDEWGRFQPGACIRPIY